MKKKIWPIWLTAIIITLTAAIYQRKTGPTYPKEYTFSVNDQEYSVKLDRAHITTKDAVIELPVSGTTVSASLYYRIYPSNDEFTCIDFQQENEVLRVTLPSRPPAGKLEYYIEMKPDGQFIALAKDSPVITRFRNDVPAYILIPHVLFMFFSMLFSSFTGLLVLFKSGNYKRYMNITIVLLFVGGLILGPFVQKHAFGEFWTGFPFGFDLTDNKTLIAFIFWMAAWFLNLRKNRPVWVATAAVMMILIFSIPHSTWGSQLDNTTGEISTGKQ
ncbi:MAG: hypothetical protein HC906_04735 [Bacteroidales bacterium]|nr:hypothetical protein [Bacteroidales bacterium]